MSKILIDDRDILEIKHGYGEYPEAKVILRGYDLNVGNFDFRPRGGFRGGKIPKWFKTYEELPKKYIINDGATILFWEDGTKTIVKRAEDDSFDPVKGFLWAYFQKNSGLSKTKANEYLRKIDQENNTDIKLVVDKVVGNISGIFDNIFNNLGGK